MSGAVAHPESKTAKKRKAKAEALAANNDAASAASDPPPQSTSAPANTNGVEATSDSPHMKDLAR